MATVKREPLSIKGALNELVQRDLYHSLSKIAKRYRSSLEEILSEDRSLHVTRARHACMVYLSDEEGFSSSVIGRLLRRDHTSVLSAIKKARRTGVESSETQAQDVSGGGPSRDP